ncbi:Transcription factor bHLH36 [Acorus calamus]|uniref:Transcription factor bHLH36 n=1 Tax=Acorus calamus TaxID=4465 RepID=A0AAV9DAV0_ACOCL|nr:Transcription factor bHLH36 [Acorus calamus]
MMKKGGGDMTTKMDRKTIEKNRRIHMKSLCFKLSSLLPHNLHKGALTQYDNLDQAANYIRSLQKRIEVLKKKKEAAMNNRKAVAEAAGYGGMMEEKKMMESLILPVIEIRDLDCTLEVVLISGLHSEFMFHQVLCVLEDEGVEVVNANFSFVGDKAFYIFHSQVKSSRVGFEITRISERLHEMIH